MASLKDLEEQSAGNADDYLNPGDQHYQDSVGRKKDDDSGDDFDKTLEDNDYSSNSADTKVDAHGDEIQRNFNADPKSDREALEDSESNPDSLYKQTAGGGPSGGFFGKLSKGTRRFGPTGGVVGILLFGIIGLGGGSSFLASSLLINIKEIFHNDRSDATRTNRLLSRAAISNKFNGDGACKKKTAMCTKMSTMSPKQITDWEDNGFKLKGTIVDTDGNRKGDYDSDRKTPLEQGSRLTVSEVTYPDGTTVRNGKDLYAHADSNPNALRRMEGAFASRAAFYTNKFFDSVLDKWKFKKGTKAFPAPDKENDDPNNQRTNENNQDKVFNQEAETVHVDPGTDAKDPKNPLRGRTTSIMGDINTKGGTAKGKIAAKGGAAGAILQGVCAVYQLGHLAETAIKAYHAYQLIRFGLLFLQAADQIKDQKGDQNRVTYLSNNLVWYDKHATTDDGKDNPKYNLSATDSEGYQIAAYGDPNGLKEFSRRFMLGGSIGQKVAGFTGTIENGLNSIPGSGIAGDNGREKMKNVCRTLQSDTGIIVTACAGLLGTGTITTGPIGFAIGAATCACTAEGVITDKLPFWEKIPNIVKSALPGIGQCEDLKRGAEAAMEQLYKLAQSKVVQDWVLDVISELHIDDNTRGVDAGNAIAAGSQLMLSTSAAGYGLRPSKSDNNHSDVAEYIAYTDSLEQTYIALQKDDAKHNPFDMDNKYSLTGTLARSLKTQEPVAAQSSLFGLFSTVTGLYKNSLNIATGLSTADALYNQPSTLSDAMSGRLDFCDDNDLKSINATGDTYCSIVGVSTKQELQSASDQAYIPGNQNIVNLIDYMTSEQPAEEGAEGATIGGTFCDTNSFADGENSSCGDPSKKPSIDENGTPVEGSQYKLYLDYCTDKRKAAWGTQFEPYTQGSQRDQDWYSGRQCLKDTNMMRNFRMWTNYCLQSGTMDGTLNCYDQGKSKPTTGKGDACSLLNNPNIVYVSDGTKKGLKEICETGKSVNSCGDTNYTLDQELMNIVTTLSSKYKVWLNNFGFQYDRFSCDGGQHPKGKAVDLNGIEKLDGSGRAGGPDWGGITYSDPKQVAVINDYASDWLAGIEPTHGGVGQQGCSSSFKPNFSTQSNVNGAAFFSDSCDHLHIDVRDRGGGGRAENRTSL